MDTDRKLAVALVVSTALNLAMGIAISTSHDVPPDQLGVCVSYYTQQTVNGTLTTVAQVGAPIKTAGTQSCADGGFVPVVAQ